MLETFVDEAQLVLFLLEPYRVDQVAAYLWDFGDGTNGTGIAPSHVYSVVGNYAVRLTVKDAAGNSASSSATATINVVIPEFSSALMFTAILILLSALAVTFRRKSPSKLRVSDWELQ